MGGRQRGTKIFGLWMFFLLNKARPGLEGDQYAEKKRGRHWKRHGNKNETKELRKK